MPVSETPLKVDTGHGGHDYVQQSLYVRGTHPYAFRSGQWAEVIGVGWLPRRHGSDPREPRPVFKVRFVDGKEDYWPVYDQVAGHEFSGSAGGCDAVSVP
jgi:hypothetical protein